MNKTIKLISAAALVVAASGAYASQDDNNADNLWIAPAVASQTATPVVTASAPAPVASAGSVRASNTQAVTP